jgi:DNA-binding beta-propeller fold protein YncE
MRRLFHLALWLTTCSPQPANVSTLSGGAPVAAGASDGTGTAALFSAPSGVALHADGSLLFVADRGNHKIRAIALATQEVWTLAGGGASGTASGAANGIGSAALFLSPWNLAFSPAFNFILVPDSNHAVRCVTLRGVVTTLAGGGATGTLAGAADGAGTAALFTDPRAIAIDPESGVAYVLERTRLRGLWPNGTTWFIAGGAAGGLTDGVGAAASMNGCSNSP